MFNNNGPLAPTKLPAWPDTISAADSERAATIMAGAKLRLRDTQPFFAALLAGMESIETLDRRTMATDGVNCFYNPHFVIWMRDHTHKGTDVHGREFILSGRQAVEAILMHEAMHKALGHHLRRGARNHKRWNMFCDYIINGELDKASIHVLACALRDAKYDGMSAEQAYGSVEDEPEQDDDDDQPSPADLPGEQDGEGGDDQPDDGDQPGQGDDADEDGDEGGDQPGSGGGDGDDDDGNLYGEVLDHPGVHENTSEDDKRTFEDRLTEELVNAKDIAEKAGNMPGSMRDMINERMAPAQSWQELLRDIAIDSQPSDFNYSRPVMKWLAQDVYAPSLHAEACPPIVCAIDTSGSIYQHREALALFFSEIEAIRDDMNCQVIVVQCDTSVIEDHVEVYEPGDDIPGDIYGGGGTEFTPVFRYFERELVDEYNPAAIVYFTDLYGSVDPDVEPEVPVLWVSYGAQTDMPFGITLNAEV